MPDSAPMRGDKLNVGNGLANRMRLLIVIDSFGFHGGAHVATMLMARELIARGISVDFLVGEVPGPEMSAKLPGARFIELPFPDHGVRRFVRRVCNRLHLGWFPVWVLDPTSKYRKLATQYDTIAVIGENSHYRGFVASVPKGPRKVVFIHTDYVRWRTAWQWNRDDARCDRWIYRHYDKIAVVGKANSKRFAACYPQFRDKVCPFINLIDATAVWTNHAPYMPRTENDVLQLVSLTRIEAAPKKVPRYLEIAQRLKERGSRFKWTVYGDGPLLDALRLEVQRRGIGDVFELAGFDASARTRLGEYDLFLLLSSWEGLPNVIYESLIAGTPVFATDVGAICEQVEHDKTGFLVRDDDEEITNALDGVLHDRARIAIWRKNLESYSYDNDKVVEQHLDILGLK